MRARSGGAARPTCCWCRITAAARRRRRRSSRRSRRDIAVYTPGYRNRFGHPRPDVVARYDARRRPELSHRLRRRADVHVRAGSRRTAAGRARARPPVLARRAGARERRRSNRLSTEPLRARAIGRHATRVDCGASVDCTRHARRAFASRRSCRVPCCSRRWSLAASSAPAQEAKDKPERVEAVGRRRPRVRAGQGGRALGEARLPRKQRRQGRRRSLFPARRSRSAIRRANSSRCATAPRISPSARRSSGRRRSSSSTCVGLPWLAPEDRGARGAGDGRVAERLVRGGRARGRRAARVRGAGSSRDGDDRQSAALARRTVAG